MSKKILAVGILIFLVAVFGLRKADSGRANFVSYDFGEIKVSETKEKDFVLKNTGSKPLRILNINSSCGCTTGKIIYNNSETKEYGMHAQSGDLLEIAPGMEAKVRIIYRPFQMPVYGAVERELYLTTDDPQREKLIFSIKASVR